MAADTALLAPFAALNSATVSDALEGCGLPPGQGGLRPMWGRPRIAGFAVTVELEPLKGEHGGAHIITGAIAEAGAHDVLVIATGSRTDVSSWGGILSVGAAMRSIRGSSPTVPTGTSSKQGSSVSRCSRGPWRCWRPPSA